MVWGNLDLGIKPVPLMAYSKYGYHGILPHHMFRWPPKKWLPC